MGRMLIFIARIAALAFLLWLLLTAMMMIVSARWTERERRRKNKK